MKCTLTFEGEGRADVRRYFEGLDWYCFAVDFDEWMRRVVKYEQTSESGKPLDHDTVEEVRRAFHAMLSSYGLDLDGE